MSTVHNNIAQAHEAQIGAEQCGLAINKPVERVEETVCKAPSQDKKEGDGHEEAVAIWKMNMSREKDKTRECNDKKEKAFSSVLG